MASNHIQYLERKEIDVEKWDACVNRSANGLIYAQSVFLDAMAVNWNAIVINDYETIIPLPLRRKFGIHYHFKPSFIQQLGIIGNIDPGEAEEIKKLIFSKIKYGVLLFNFSNEVFTRNTEAYSLVNMIIDLSSKYSDLFKRYAVSAKRNINQAARNNLFYAESQDPGEAIDQYEAMYGARLASVDSSDFSRLKILCEQLYKKKMAIVRRVTNSEGAVLSSTLFLKDSKRIYNLLPSTSAEGRRLRGNYFLMDNLMKEFAEKPLIFDLEGSDVKGVKEFYSKFGCRNEPYYYLDFNHLPWPVNLLKK